MRRRRSVGAFCIALLAAVTACDRAGEGEAASDQAAATGVEAFFRYGMVELGPTRAEFRAQLGEPDSTTVRPLPNPHDASVVDSVITLHYPDLEAEVYRAGFDGRELLATLRIRSDRYLRAESPIRLATHPDELQVVLGPPDESEDEDMLYRCTTCTVDGNDIVRLHVDRGVLREVAVHYSIE